MTTTGHEPVLDTYRSFHHLVIPLTSLVGSRSA